MQYLTSDFDEPIDADHPGKFLLQELDSLGTPSVRHCQYRAFLYSY
jgi:hypothetical protein